MQSDTDLLWQNVLNSVIACAQARLVRPSAYCSRASLAKRLSCPQTDFITEGLDTSVLPQLQKARIAVIGRVLFLAHSLKQPLKRRRGRRGCA